MPVIDKTSVRVITLIVLLVLVGATLRGYLPAAGRASHHQETGSKAALTIMVVLLGVSLGIIAVAIINRVRNRRTVAGNFSALSAGSEGGEGRPGWRALLIGLVVLAAWLLVVWLLRNLVGHHGFGQFGLVPGGHSDVPTTGTAPPPTGTPPRSEWPQPKSGGDVFRYLAATAVGMLLLIVASIVSPRTRRGSPKPPSLDDERLEPTAPSAEPETLARAAELGLAEIGDLSREPREAIIGCYATMERELAHVPDAVPQDFDTPTEVLTRAVEHRALTLDNATQLVNLFAEARFSRHLMTEVHREDAVRTLRLVLAELRRQT